MHDKRIEMIKVGDRVKFLNDVGGGIVTGYVGKNMVTVENADGFEVPYPVSQLVNVDDPSLNKKDAVAAKPPVKSAPVVKPKIKTGGTVLSGKDSPDFYFCFVPSDPKNPIGGDIHLYLVNDSNFKILFRYGHFSNYNYTHVLHGLLQPNTRKELETIGVGDLAELPEYFFQLIYYKNEEKEWHAPVVKKFRVNPVKFYKEKSFQPNTFFPKNAMLFKVWENILDAEIDTLTDDDFKKVVREKEKAEATKEPVKKPAQSEDVEVDLHIHELIDNFADLSNKEMLEIQMEKVERVMDSAIRSRARRIIFIHGVGQGVLKQEIAKLLKSKFSRYDYQDASFKEYGYGATMVILRRK